MKDTTMNYETHIREADDLEVWTDPVTGTIIQGDDDQLWVLTKIYRSEDLTHIEIQQAAEPRRKLLVITVNLTKQIAGVYEIN